MQDRVYTPPTPQQTSSDEVDIRAVFTAVGRFFKRLGNSFLVAILSIRRVTRKFIKLIIACALIGIGIGYLSYRTFEPYYASELTVSSHYYSHEMLKSAIHELNQLASEQNHVILGRKLNINPEQASVIRSFEVQSMVLTKDLIEIEALVQAVSSNDNLTDEQQEELRNRLMENTTSFKIITTVYDVSVLDQLENGIMTFLRDNDYIRRRVAIEQENLILLRDKIRRDQEQLSQLKSLQAEAYRRIAETGQTGSNNVIFGTPETANAPLNVYVQDLEFSRELQNINERLELNRGLEIVSGFTPYGAPASLSLRGQLILGAIIGLAVAYTIILLISINKALNSYEAKHLSTRIPA
jgi:hypothetical protein